MSKHAGQQRRAEVKAMRHDANVWRDIAKGRSNPQDAAGNRAHADKLDRQANQKEGK